MTLELFNAKLPATAHAVSMVAHTGQLTCLTSATVSLCARWLQVLMGFEPLAEGLVCLDGEPLTPFTAPRFRRFMAYAPSRLEPVGQLSPVMPPTVEQLFHLRRNREQPISNAILAEEQRRTAGSAADPRTQLLAVAALLRTPILLVADPLSATAPYLRSLADEGRMVVVASNDAAVQQAAHLVVPIF